MKTGSSIDSGSLPQREAIEMLGYMVVTFQVITLLGVLRPQKPKPPAHGSDGWQLLRTPFLSENEMEQSLCNTYARKGHVLMLDADPDRALDCFTQGLQKYPSSWLLHYCCGLCYRDRDRQTEAVDHLLKAAESTQLPQNMRTEVLDALACVPLFSGKAEFLPQADGWSLRALEMEPKSLTLKGTRGSVLVELGRIEDGRQLLEEVLKDSPSANDKSISACFLALASSKQGDSEGAAKLLDHAGRLNANCVVLKRITEQVLGSHTS